MSRNAGYLPPQFGRPACLIVMQSMKRTKLARKKLWARNCTMPGGFAASLRANPRKKGNEIGEELTTIAISVCKSTMYTYARSRLSPHQTKRAKNNVYKNILKI